MSTGVRCPRGHRLVRWEPDGCDGHGVHRVHVCPMRVGSRRCGEVVVVPRYSDACDPDRDA